MGYYVDTLVHDITIEEAHFERAHELLKELMVREKSASGGYAWADTKVVMEALKNNEDKGEGLVEALEELGYAFILGPFIRIRLCRRIMDQLGHDEMLFTALAPVFKNGSFIRFRGEDGDHWEWSFHDGKLVEKTGRVVYD
jgi:hypothetical protein